MVLDDATSALDVHVEEAILAGLAERGPEAGDRPARTTILIAHRLSTIAAADRVVLLEAGRVKASGRHSELMATEPAYAEVLAHLDEDDAAGSTNGAETGSGDNGDGRPSDEPVTDGVPGGGQ